ncbi:hypothetical protein BDV97DRAFT_352391 [Delphinella strobiligena]|nr:hypothetical protein BDV97DRAFT_352391 [Delphinella strobiligena]
MESQSHLNLDGVSEALYVLPSRDTPPPSYHPVPVLKERIHRNNFLYLCNQSAPIYEAVRGFLDDKSYWMKEEYHFSLINELIRLHNIIDGTCWRLEDAVCPPVDVIRKLYTDHQSCISRSGITPPILSPIASSPQTSSTRTQIRSRQKRRSSAKPIASRTRSKNDLRSRAIRSL